MYNDGMLYALGNNGWTTMYGQRPQGYEQKKRAMSAVVRDLERHSGIPNYSSGG